MSNSSTHTSSVRFNDSSVVDLLEGELSQRYSEQASEIAQARELNAELLERLAELRRRTADFGKLEKLRRETEAELQRLRESESVLRQELDARDKERSEQRMKLEESRSKLTELQRISIEEQKGFFQIRTDLTKKLTKMTDENWEKDLEIERLRKFGVDTQNEVQRLRQETMRELEEAKQNHTRELEALQERSAALGSQLTQLAADRASLQEQLASLNQDFNDLEQAFYGKENELEQAAREFEIKVREIKDSHAQLIQDLRSESQREMEKLEACANERSSMISNLQADVVKLEQALSEVRTAHAEVERTLGIERAEKEEMRKRVSEIEQKRSAEIEGFCRLEAERNSKIQSLEAICSDQGKKLNDLHHLATGLRTENEALKLELAKTQENASQLLRESQHKHAMDVDTFRRQETQLNANISHLLAERSGLERQLKEAGENVSELKTILERQKGEREAEQRYLEMKASRYIADLQAKLEGDFQGQLEAAKREVDDLRTKLAAREQASEAEQRNLDEWRKTIEARENAAREERVVHQRTRSELLRLTKILAEEHRLARETHPLKDYLNFASGELNKLQLQLKNTPAMAPERPQMEHHFSQMVKEFEFLNSVLGKSQAQLEERSKVAAGLIAGVEQLPQ